MNIKIEKLIKGAKIMVEVEDKNDKEALAKAVFFTAPDYCGECKKNNIVWNTNKAKADDGGTYTYIKRVCLDCGSQSQMGEYKTGGFFWKKWEQYVPPLESKKDGEITIENF